MNYVKFVSLCLCFSAFLYSTGHSEFIKKENFMVNVDASSLILQITIPMDSADINDLDRKRSHRRRRMIRKPTRGRNPK